MYNLAYFYLEEKNNKLVLRYPQSEDDSDFDRKFIIIMFSLWALIAGTITAVPLFMHKYAHAILFFIVLGIGGLFICINVAKRTEMKYYSVQIDNNGIHEIWNYPNKTLSKTIFWNDLRYRNIYNCVVSRAGKPSLPFDCILFSSELIDDKTRIKQIRKIWRSSMQYELKFRDVEKNIFIMVRSSEGETVYAYLSDYIDNILQNKGK